MTRPQSRVIQWRWQTVVDTKDRQWLNGDQSCYFNRLMDLGAPVEANDAATKAYVDSATASSCIGAANHIPIIDDDGIGLKDSGAFISDFMPAGTIGGAQVDVTGAVNSYVLTWDAISGKWVPASKFWTDMPGSPVRVSNTQFTITDTANANYYNLAFGPGTLLRWEASGGGFRVARVASATYAANAVTINIVGSALEAGFTTMRYCIFQCPMVEFLLPGTQAVANGVGKIWFAPVSLYPISCDGRVATAGTTGSGTYDINDDGTTVFNGTSCSISSGATSSLNNAAYSPVTAIDSGSAITVDCTAIHTTPAVDAYLYLFYMPISWRYR